MSSKDMEEIIRTSHDWREGKDFSAADARRKIQSYGFKVTLERAKEVMQTMVRNGEAKNKQSKYYRYTVSDVYKSWRTTSDHDLGIRRTFLGNLGLVQLTERGNV